MLRPRPARWFEILAARDDATLVLEALARTGAVELEARPPAALPASWAALAPRLALAAEIEARCRAFWPPAAACPPSAFPEPPAAALERSLATLQAWWQDAEPGIRALQRDEAELAQWQLWQRALGALPEGVDTAALAGAGPWLGARLLVLPPAHDTATPPWAALPGVVATPLALPGPQRLVLVVATPEALAALAPAATLAKGTLHALPLRLDAAFAEALQARIAAQRAALAALNERHGIPRALGDVHRLQWLLHNVHALEAGDWLCWVTGWSGDALGDTLQAALQDSGARALLHFAPPPAGMQAPLLLDNPPWARPFEIFANALGMPAADEADPSPVLAVAVPLMFGYMFGDVGQGLVIAAGGFWFRRRFAVARLLMVGGLAAAAFGALFGSVFSLHGLLHPLWLHPLDAPLAVLAAPLVFGAALLSLGLALDALSAHWRGEFGRWCLTDAAVVVGYGALLSAFWWPPGLALAGIALAWFCVGHGLVARRPVAAFGALGEALEKTVQLGIHTLSFARVGAFALAHAGLSSALVALMDAADSVVAKGAVLVLGNVLVIVLEAMVVSIQTTRLVLFEFFTRFMQGRGRAFRPLPPPPFTAGTTRLET